MMKTDVTVTWLLTLVLLVTSQEVLQNGGFESLDGWTCSGCTLTLTTDAHSGQHALQTSNRHFTTHGPLQYMNLTAGAAYDVEVWVKLLDYLRHDEAVTVGVRVEWTDHTQSYWPVAERHLMNESDGWVRMKGSFLVPNRSIGLARSWIYIAGPRPALNFIVDDASVVPVPHDANWRQSTDQVIENIRTGDIRIRVTAAGNIAADDVQIRVLQTKKSFPFGAWVSASFYDGADQALRDKYRDFVHTHFNWATPRETLTWMFIEPQQGQTNYEPALSMIRELKTHGVKIRGHYLLSPLLWHLPSWLMSLAGESLKKAVAQHIQGLLIATDGVVDQWDVVHGSMYGQFFQEKIQDASYVQDIFRQVEKLSPGTVHLIDDDGTVANGYSTQEFMEQCQKLKEANVGLDGLGAQCGFDAETDPSPDLIKERLDTLAQVGLPVWATNLITHSDDENKRADYYEHALRALYGHPAVQGIMFGAFWDQELNTESVALARGDDFELTEAGRRVLDLLENQWMTDETHRLSQTGNQFTVRGFHGDYEVHVIYQGRELTNLKQTFSLDRGGHDVHLNVHI